jgi:hypothetical protein
MHLAQLNIAKAKYALDAPEIKDFVDNLDPVNQLSEPSDSPYAFTFKSNFSASESQ